MLKLAVAHAKGQVNTFRSRLAYLALSLLIVAGSLAALVLTAEYFFRWYYSDVLSSPHERDFFYNRSAAKFYRERNALGGRGKDFDIGNRHAMRVVVLGDSFAYGQGVWPYEKRFPEQTLKLFQEQYPGRDLEIINLGIPGMNLHHYIKFVRKFVIKLNPDFVLYQWFINDVCYKTDVKAFMTPPLIPTPRLHKFLTEHSVLYFLAEQAWRQLRTLFGKQVSYTDYMISTFKDPESENSLAAKKRLKRLLTILDNEAIDHGIVLFPSFATRMKDYRLGFLHEQVLDVCQERNIPCLDLRQAFSKHDEPLKGLWANTFDAHPSELAHRVAAEEIFKFFGPGWASSIDGKETQQ